MSGNPETDYSGKDEISSIYPITSAEYQPSRLAQAALLAASNGLKKGSSNSRFSVAALWSIAAENDPEVGDKLALCILLLKQYRKV
jgi:hypothetical protein